jgi:hypothetical protein
MEKNLNLKQIQEFFSKPLEENTFKVGDKITYLGHPGEITATKEYNGRNFVSVSYDKGKGKTKASDILTTDGTVKAVAEGFKDYLGYSSVEVSRPTQDQVDRFFALTQNETHYLNSKPVAGQEKTFNKMEVEPWDEYDLSNWNSLVRKAKAKGKSLDEAKVDYDFSERELIRVLRQLKRNASTEIDMIKAFTKALGRDITKDELFSESIDEDQSYASTFGGSSKKLDGREIKIELKKRGYDTPSTGIWNKILVKKNGERMGMIDTDNSYYTKGGQMYKWRGTSNFIDHVESIAEGFKDYLGYSEKTSRVSMPRFVKDKNNPNFLNVYIDYDLGPGGSSIALGKETMTGQIRRESAAKAMKVAGNIARDLETKYNLEDIDIQDLENGKVRIFAVSDDFINMDPNMLGESLNESQKEEYDSLLDKEYDLTAAYTKDKTEANWKKLSDIRKKGKKLEKELEDQGLLHEEEDKIDIVTMDVPLFIRALEYAKEDAQEDMDLHDFAERAIAATKEQGILQMDDYDMLVGDKEPMNKLTVAEKVIAQLKEEKPGLWANIRAKKARGKKPAHGNSDAFKSAKKAGKKINSLTEEEGVPHYTKDGKEWKGKVHKMPDNSLMSGNPHDKNGSGPNGKSEKLFHKEDLNEITPVVMKNILKFNIKYVTGGHGLVNIAFN